MVLQVIFPPDQVHVSWGKMDHIMLPVGRTQPAGRSPMNCVVAHGCSGLARP